MKINYLQIVTSVFSTFFLLTLLSQLFNLINLDLHIPQLMSIIFLFSGLYCATKIRFKGFDILMFIYLTYIILNGIMIDYNHHGEFLYRALLSHVFPMMCYFIGRYIKIDIGLYLKNMKWPLIFAMISGLIFFFTMPSWYIAMKESQLVAGASEMRVAEIYRLSSFWGHPYVIGYSTFLYCIYETFILIKGINNKKELLLHLLILLICLTVLLLAQLRVTILVYILSLVYMILFAKKASLTNKFGVIFKILLFSSVFGVIFIDLASENMDYISNHILGLAENDFMSSRFNHTSGGIVYYSLLGDGLGRYGYPAREYGGWAIVDNEFQCHLAELGYIGFVLLLLVIFFTFIKCTTRKELVIENSIYAFFCIAMLGASVLSNHHQFNYIFWYVIGYLWSPQNKIRKFKNIQCQLSMP